VFVSVWLCSCLPGQASDPRDITPEGEYAHAPSGLRFPLRVGEFQREKVLQYDAVGNDVSVGYNLEIPSSLMAATVYMYPLTARSFDDELASVQRAHASFALTARRELVLERGGEKQGCQLAEFSYEEVFAHQFGPVSSCLLVCDRDPWRIKWRFTYRSSSEKALTDDMRRLATELSFRK
jgi:hypothetical protein